MFHVSSSAYKFRERNFNKINEALLFVYSKGMYKTNYVVSFGKPLLKSTYAISRSSAGIALWLGRTSSKDLALSRRMKNSRVFLKAFAEGSVARVTTKVETKTKKFREYSPHN